MADHHLVTTCCFKGREYLVKMNIVNNTLIDITITDKYSGEDWQCNYDAAYIESLTQRTGNFKQFNIFITMLKSGLLKTSDCVSLDLLTFEDLEILRSRKSKPFSAASGSFGNGKYNVTTNNRRYLILTYSVEFDRIHYPLPLDYCGPPDPQILQANIRRLETEVSRLQEIIADNAANAMNSSKWKHTIEILTDENKTLKSEIKHLRMKNTSSHQMEFLHDAIKTLEESVINERNSHNKLIMQLQKENDMLKQQVLSLHEKLKFYMDSNIRKKVSPHRGLRLSDPGLNLLFINQKPKNSSSCLKNIDQEVGGKKKFQSIINPEIMPQVSRIESWETTLRRHNIIEPPRRRHRSISKGSPSRRKKQISVDEMMEPSPTKHKSRRDKAHRNRSRSTSNSRTRTSSTESMSRRNNIEKIQSQTYQTMRVDSVRKLHSEHEQHEATSSEYCENLAHRIQALQKLISDSVIH